MKKLLIIIFLLMNLNAFSQNQFTQTIRGSVVDMNTGLPLPGATVVLLKSNPVIGTITNENGEFKIQGVPIGRQDIQVSFMGYNNSIINNLLVNSGKEIVLTVKLEERVIVTEDIIIRANSNKDQAINEMAQVSARSFTVEQTERFAGSMGDPSRMVANYAGVAAIGDSRNDIIIRGNSPIGVLWRIDGVTVPNPNHFGALGTTGGPVSMLNNNLLTNSDFFTGAFPAEYGNAISGAFDIGMRSGNNEKHEYVGQIGFNGFEFGMEGPFSKKSKASYLVNYRYSTLAVFDKLGLDLKIGGIPQYQDLSFKINIPDSKLGRISVFGIGGLSYIELLQSTNKENEDNMYEFSGQDTRFGSDMGVIGFSHSYYFNTEREKGSSIKTVFSISGTRTTTKIDTFQINKVTNEKTAPFLWFGDKSSEIIYNISSQYKKKFNSKNYLSIGVDASLYEFNYNDSFYLKNRYIKHAQIENGSSYLLQGFIQWQHRFNDNLTLYTGVHSQRFSLNNSWAIEPRASLKINFNTKQTITFGYGLHSQIQPRKIYFYETRDSIFDTNKNLIGLNYHKTNKDLGFLKSHHLVVSYSNLISRNVRLKIETYYQSLFNIPVEQRLSNYSMVNSGADFYIDAPDSLINKGSGDNYGVEFTFERFLNNNFYFLLTTSLFESKYKGSDGTKRNTAFNSNYVINFLAGYEFIIKDKNRLAFDVRTVVAGGKRYTPIDLSSSREAGTVKYFENRAFELQYPAYFRLDLRISFKMNGKLFNQEWGIDFQNITMQKNILQKVYDPTTGTIRDSFQIGFMPMMLYRIQF